MFNRLIPKRQCIRSQSISTRNVCSLIRSNFLFSNPHITATQTQHLCDILPTHIFTHNIRHFGKIKTYNQPGVGEGTVEVDILEWLIKPGDIIKPLDIIGRGKYEKADVDILAPAYAAKVHRIVVEAGCVAIVGKPLVEFEIDDDDHSSIDAPLVQGTDTDTATTSATIAKQTTEGSTSKLNQGILALPATKHFAKEHGIDLNKVIGTGKAGRILKEDVMAYMEAMNAKKQTVPSSETKAPPKIIKPMTHKPVPVPLSVLRQTRTDTVEKIFGVKKAMVRKMTEANNVPLFGYGDEVIMDELVQLRKDLKSVGLKYGIKITYLPFILKATSLALNNPQSMCLNAHINAECTELTHRGSHNIGVAIDSSEGLIVPNIKDVEQKSIVEIGKDLEDLVARGKNGQINNEDITGGTFTLSNIGAIGGTYCSPICFVPEVCIGALGAIKQHPRYNERNEVYNASIMNVSWSADHRVIDGATVARFSNEFKGYLENPSTMLLHLK